MAIAIPVGSFVTARFSVFSVLYCIANFQASLLQGVVDVRGGCPTSGSMSTVSIRSRSDVWRAGSAANLGMVQR